MRQEEGGEDVRIVVACWTWACGAQECRLIVECVHAAVRISRPVLPVYRCAGVLGEGPDDRFDPALLREEPLDKVKAVLREAQRIHGL